MARSEKLEKGIALFNSRDFAGAEKIFVECLAAGPDPDAALFLRHSREALKGLSPRPPQDVVDVFAAVAAGDPAALSSAARKLFRRDRPAAARVLRDIWVAKKDRAFASGKAAASRSPWALFLRASLLWDERRDEEALALLRRAAATKETSWMRYYVAEILTRRLDRFEAALREIQEVEKSAPWLWEAPFLRAELRWALGTEPEEVLAPLEHSAPPPSHRPSMLAWRGAVKMWLGRAKESLPDLDAAASAGQHDASCWRGGARALLGLLDAARADLDALLERDADDHEALIWRGEVLRRLGLLRESRRDLERALELSSAEVWAWANLALLALDENGLDEARAVSRGFSHPRLEPKNSPRRASARNWKKRSPRPAACGAPTPT